jgi:branched-chain amino acid transport system ATP-binding protein
MESTILSINDLNAGYGKFHVLFDISMSVRKNTICAILGPNGSGKSTLLKTIFGLATLYSGSIYFNGNSISRLPPHKIRGLGIAYVPQIGNVFSKLTVKENLLMSSYLLTKEDTEDGIVQALDFFPVLKVYLNKKAGRLSGGERQMLGMAMSLVVKPSLMVFDEPTGNLAPTIRNQVLSKILELRGTGISVILVEQNVRRALEISDHAYLLVSGKKIFEGTSDRLLEDPQLGKLYLGL